MNEEMRTEAIELSITACEKYASNYEVSSYLCNFIKFFDYNCINLNSKLPASSRKPWIRNLAFIGML